MSVKKFCDDCGNEIRFGCDPISPTRKFGVSSTLNPSIATKFAVMVSVHFHESSKQPDLCGYCLNKIITEMVVFDAKSTLPT